jgi:hypothetical protein
MIFRHILPYLLAALATSLLVSCISVTDQTIVQNLPRATPISDLSRISIVNATNVDDFDFDELNRCSHIAKLSAENRYTFIDCHGKPVDDGAFEFFYQSQRYPNIYVTTFCQHPGVNCRYVPVRKSGDLLVLYNTLKATEEPGVEKWAEYAKTDEERSLLNSLFPSNGKPDYRWDVFGVKAASVEQLFLLAYLIAESPLKGTEIWFLRLQS